MNAFQEVILDQLMAADRIGDYWHGGPLALAVDALRTAGLTTHQDPARALGYPEELCQALQGASKIFESMDERRTLAISVFTEIPPRERGPRRSLRQQVEGALWSVRRARSLVSQRGGPAETAEAVIAQYLAGQTVEAAVIERVSAQLDQAIDRTPELTREFTAERLALAACFFALHAARQAGAKQPARENAARAARDAARLAALVQGVPGAVTFCLDFGEQLGM
jgi:hypothetical protein